MFDRPAGGEQAVLVHLEFPGTDFESDRIEFEELARSAGAEVLAVVGGRRDRPDAGLFVGSGKVEEIAELVANHDAQLVIFNHELSPSQERNLEKRLSCRVLDRTRLILDIFARRARSHEGKLQVELAQLQHMATRLVRGWTHLERQKGGIGLRGPGETQLETDRRLIRERIATLKKRIEVVRGQRQLARRARTRSQTPTVSIVGYTNAGKSTLFNALTGAESFASDQLFATLDTTVRRLHLPDGGLTVLADTVGFIRDLPHDLVAAFRATLEEAREADLLLHVVDASDPEHMVRIEQVQNVLNEINAQEVPTLLVFNKIDCRDDAPARIEHAEDGTPIRVWVSARTGAGLPLLKKAIGERLFEPVVEDELIVPASAGRLRAQLFALKVVCSEQSDEDGTVRLKVRLPRSQLEELCAAAGVAPPQRPSLPASV
jgi:GTP-binding protein HflX